MLNVTAGRSILKRLALAGAFALAAAGATTTARAMPMSPIDSGATTPQAVRYVDGYRHHHHDRHHPRRYGYHGRSGLYSCAPGHVNSNLARKACGGTKFPNRFY